ncbi:MAG: penicillin-binding protein 2 [Candidatus Kaiserbacteria bacterium]|nr:penicillin-binding protein 2 [Candidatus Kaiserbacteria bacterium]
MPPDSYRSPYTVFYLVILIALLAIVLLFENQVNRYVEPLESQVLPFRSVGNRGHIFFTDKDGGRHLAATTHFGYNLTISPLELGDPEEIYEHLAQEISLDRDAFFASAGKKETDEYEILRRNIPKSVKERIEDRIAMYNLEGVWLESFQQREYPFGSLGAHVLGFVSVDEDDRVRGQYGIENLFDEVLSGISQSPRSAKVTLLKQLGEIDEKDPVILAGNVILSIDINAQRYLERVLQGIQNQWGAEKVGGIVMRPESGEVVAMGSRPTFDPNHYSKVTDYSTFNNPVVEDVYEMGSVFKALTMAIGIDSESVSPEDVYNDRGSVTIDGETISNFDLKGRGPGTSMQTVLSQSLNTGAVFVLQQTGLETYREYFEEFGFDGITRIDLPKETTGFTDNLDSNREVEFATASFGQGIAVTPIATVRAFASLANDGVVVQPYTVKEIEQPKVGGIILGTANSREERQVFDKETAEVVSAMLTRAYDRGIAGGAFRDPQYTIAAKTGTAQLVDPETGGYAEGRVLHSFFGYLPASDPQFIVFLFAVDPSAKYASGTLPSPFRTIANFLISYYGIPPDR